MSLPDLLVWYGNVLFESTIFSVFMIIFLVCAITYYARCKRKAIRWGCCPQFVSYEIEV